MHRTGAGRANSSTPRTTNSDPRKGNGNQRRVHCHSSSTPNRNTELSSRRQPSSPLISMESYHRQFMGTTMHTGLWLRVLSVPTAGQLASTLPLPVQGTGDGLGPGDQRPALQKSSGIGSKQERFLQPYVHSPKEGRRMAAYYQPETPKLLSGSTPLQNGRNPRPEGYPPNERLHGEDRFERRISHSICERVSSRLPEVSVERPELQILQSTFRSGHSPQSVHKDSEASGSKVTEAGYSDSVLSGRPTSTGTIPADARPAHTASGPRVDQPGIQTESQKVCLDTHTKASFSRIPDRFHSDETVSTIREGGEDHQRVSTFCQQIRSISPGPCSLNRPTVFYNFCNRGGSFALQGSPKASSPHSDKG